MYARVNQYAQWFLAQNVKPGQLVVMYMTNSSDFMCAWYGLMAIGAAPAMINTNLASKALVHCVEIAQAKLILADGDGEMLDRLQAVRAELEASGHQIVYLRDVRDRILGSKPVRPSDELRRGITIDSPMMLAYTSGTTGLPKAIVFPVLIVNLTAAVVCRDTALEMALLVKSTDEPTRETGGTTRSRVPKSGSTIACRFTTAQADCQPAKPLQ